MKKTFLLCAIFCLGQWTLAQDPFQSFLFSADFVIHNKNAIRLNARQEGQIKAIHNESLQVFSEKRTELNQATEQLRILLAAEKFDHRRINQQLDTVLALENELKKQRINTLLAIRNVLNRDQFAQLQELKQHEGASGFKAQGNEMVSIRSEGAGTENSPAYFIDRNGEYTRISDISLIGPKDIASITVLRGDTALIKFGDEGSNGVIIITLNNDL